MPPAALINNIRGTQLAQHREKNRQSILDAFEDLPEIIAMAHSKSAIFPDDKNLQESISQLQATLLQAIPNLVGILKPGTYCQWLPTAPIATGISRAAG